MNIDKSIRAGLLKKGYRTRKAFADDKGISQGALTRVSKNSPDTKIGTLMVIANGFDTSLSEFIAWGEEDDATTS